MILRVHSLPGMPTRGLAESAGMAWPCTLGRGGTTADKREGDGATPIARMAVRRLHFRPDRGPWPAPRLPRRPIRPDDGWCDDPAHTDYNRLVRLPFAASHETMWRDDALYDLVVELGWNDAPPIPGRGSAIFMHVARSDFSPTEGCIAFRASDLRRLVRRLTPDSRIEIIR